jgi:hypothetical protein
LVIMNGGTVVASTVTATSPSFNFFNSINFKKYFVGYC